MVYCEELLDRCYRLLDRAYEESYGKGYSYGKPKFRIVLSAEEIRALQLHILKSPMSHPVTIKEGRPFLFGHELQEQRRTPYIEAIIGSVATVNKEVLND